VQFAHDSLWTKTVDALDERIDVPRRKGDEEEMEMDMAIQPGRIECQETRGQSAKKQEIEPRKVVNDIVHRQCELERIFYYKELDKCPCLEITLETEWDPHQVCFLQASGDTPGGFMKSVRGRLL